MKFVEDSVNDNYAEIPVPDTPEQVAGAKADMENQRPPWEFRTKLTAEPGQAILVFDR
jgi:hypothetical protein